MIISLISWALYTNNEIMSNTNQFHIKIILLQFHKISWLHPLWKGINGRLTPGNRNAAIVADVFEFVKKSVAE